MRTIYLLLITALLLVPTLSTAHNPPFTDNFLIDQCQFTATGRNPFFILEPGFRAVYEGEEDGETIRLQIRVLNATKMVAGVQTRVVEERESNLDTGELIEVSRNYFAICKKTNSVFYFGEAVDIYEDGEIVSHDGAWLAGENGAEPGIIMPGTFLIGGRHFQETAPGIALDRAEIISLDATVTTPARTFENCLKVKETTPLEPGHIDFKYYARGVGGVRLNTLLLIDYNDPNAP